MNCKEACKAIEQLRDLPAAGTRDMARLLDPLAAAVRVHAEACARCREMVAGEARLQDSLAFLRRQVIPVPFGFDSSVRRRIAAEGGRRSGAAAASPSRDVFGWPFLLSAIASSVALAIIVAVALRESPGTEVAATRDPVAASSPILWSDGQVEVIAQPPSEPRPMPAQLAVLVEYDL
jgi:hypothetical protein